MAQEVAVYLILTVAVLLLLRRIFRKKKPDASCTSCAGCPLHGKCNKTNDKT